MEINSNLGQNKAAVVGIIKATDTLAQRAAKKIMSKAGIDQHLRDEEMSLKFSDVPSMFHDFQLMRSSQDQYKTYLIVKQAALIPDEAMEEDIEVSKGVKEVYNTVMRHKHYRGKSLQLQEAQ